ncbi:hypothetical protein C0J52_25606, partial [Blattella germanica]
LYVVFLAPLRFINNLVNFSYWILLKIIFVIQELLSENRRSFTFENFSMYIIVHCIKIDS